MPPSPPAKTQVLRWGSGSDTEEAERFLQSRIAMYVRLMGALFGAMYLAGAALLAIVAPEQLVRVHSHPSKVLNLGLSLVLLLAWLLLRRARYSAAVLRAVDLGSMLVIAVGIGVGAVWAPGGYHLEFAVLMILILALVLRAAIVPSTPFWTALIGLACAPPVVFGGYEQVILGGSLGFVTPRMVIVALALWCIAAAAMTTTISRVIYGLATQVREATRLGQYTLRDKLGEGGMGAVYRAEHGMLRRATAVKLLLPERVGAENLARFEREVQVTSQLSHPNTVAIYDYGRTPGGVFYYAMEFLEGRTLEKLVGEEGPQPPGRVVHILLQIAGALREAHDAGVIHRDIKPSNVLLCTRGGIREYVKVIDFGLVKRIDGGEATHLTRADAIAGTPLFMAPECLTRPGTVDASIDVYSLGGVGYFLLTGAPPFSGRTVVEVCGHHLHTPPTPPSERLGSSLPEQLESLVLRCLAKEAATRPSDTELASVLRACQRESPWSVI